MTGNSFNEKRLQNLKKRLEEAIELLDEYEEALGLIDIRDRRGLKDCEKNIEHQKQLIATYKQEYDKIQYEVGQDSQRISPLRLFKDIEILFEPFSPNLENWEPNKPPTPKPPPKESHKGDYRRLQELLGAQKWRDADLETMSIILKITNREREQWLRIKEDIGQIPCEDIRIVNRLWEKFSNSKFGFAAQQETWCQVGGYSGQFDYGIYVSFGHKVGWYVGNEWLPSYDSMTFSLNAPKGHLPTLRLPGGRINSWQSNFKGFLVRVSNCLST